MKGKPEDRVDRIVSDLLRGRRLKLRGGDAEEKEAITVAARLAAARRGTQRMDPAFRRRLADALREAPQGTWVTTRRAALVAGLGVAAGALGGGALSRALEPAQQSAGPRASAAVKPTNGRWIDVGALADFDDGEGRLVHAGAVGAFVFRKGDDVQAVSSICSHLPCELSWQSANAILLCPCHNVGFKRDGTPVSTAYPMPSLNAVQARVSAEGRVEVLGV